MDPFFVCETIVAAWSDCLFIESWLEETGTEGHGCDLRLRNRIADSHHATRTFSVTSSVQLLSALWRV